jgi:stearoyl-CoA desaturase (delta-9 desaturase)
MTQSQPLASPRKKVTINYLTMLLFGVVAGCALIGVPAFAYRYGFTWLDWTMFAVLYAVSGLGITVGYHRLLAHRSFDCLPWVKAGFLIGAEVGRGPYPPPCEL